MAVPWGDTDAHSMQVHRSKGAHRKSAESGTLHRKMRGLEYAWQLLEKSHSGQSSAVAVSLPSGEHGDGSGVSGPASISETLSPGPAGSMAEARGKAQVGVEHSAPRSPHCG